MAMAFELKNIVLKNIVTKNIKKRIGNISICDNMDDTEVCIVSLMESLSSLRGDYDFCSTPRHPKQAIA